MSTSLFHGAINPGRGLRGAWPLGLAAAFAICACGGSEGETKPVGAGMGGVSATSKGAGAAGGRWSGTGGDRGAIPGPAGGVVGTDSKTDNGGTSGNEKGGDGGRAKGGRGGTMASSGGQGGLTMTTQAPKPGKEPVYSEVDGVVAVEAEHFFENDDQGTPRAWHLTTTDNEPGIKPDPDKSHADSANGMAYLEALPDTRVTHDDSLKDALYNKPGSGATVRYRVHFSNPGKYIVWVRAFSTGGEDNGIHVGVNGQWPGSGERVQFCSGKNAWTWSSAQRDSGGSACGKPGTISVEIAKAGEHVIAFSMREDGFEFDKFVLAKSPDFVPKGAGPDEKTR